MIHLTVLVGNKNMKASEMQYCEYRDRKRTMKKQSSLFTAMQQTTDKRNIN